jgi:23S rRNA pseudouridine1911/1915/1917 synthase
VTDNPLPLSVLTENANWLAINKPAGLIVERNPFESPTVEELVFDHLASKTKKPYVGIVHRLDRVTSGVMIFAKKKSILRKLNEQFAQQKNQKTYLAITESVPSEKTGTLRHWLYKNQKEKRADIFHRPGENRKEVVLTYKLLKEWKGMALLEITPLTGKFHQIRAQLAAINCPVLGDVKYGAQQPYETLSVGLHAWKLQIQDPVSNEDLILEVPYPDQKIWNAFFSS